MMQSPITILIGENVELESILEELLAVDPISHVYSFIIVQLFTIHQKIKDYFKHFEILALK